jgi:hypothetical protein
MISIDIYINFLFFFDLRLFIENNLNQDCFLFIMEKRYIISIILVFAVIAIFLTVYLIKIFSFGIMPFGFKFGFAVLFIIAGVLLWLTYSMLK